MSNDDCINNAFEVALEGIEIPEAPTTVRRTRGPMPVHVVSLLSEDTESGKLTTWATKNGSKSVSRLVCHITPSTSSRKYYKSDWEWFQDGVSTQVKLVHGNVTQAKITSSPAIFPYSSTAWECPECGHRGLLETRKKDVKTPVCVECLKKAATAYVSKEWSVSKLAPSFVRRSQQEELNRQLQRVEEEPYKFVGCSIPTEMVNAGEVQYTLSDKQEQLLFDSVMSDDRYEPDIHMLFNKGTAPGAYTPSSSVATEVQQRYLDAGYDVLPIRHRLVNPAVKGCVGLVYVGPKVTSFETTKDRLFTQESSTLGYKRTFLPRSLAEKFKYHGNRQILRPHLDENKKEKVKVNYNTVVVV